MQRQFNREMLTLARESRGLTQEELASELAITQAEVSKYENGLRMPSDEQIQRIAKSLHYDEQFFYISESVRGFGSGCVHYRKRKSTTETKLRQLLAVMNVRRIQVAQLLRATTIDAQTQFQQFDIDEYESPQRIAQMVRHLWKLPPGPVQNLVRAIESAGGVIIRCDFGTNKVDAMSQWLPGLPPVFLVNSAIPTDRLRWTLAHELGHIFMHNVLTENMEKEADSFASEFLMPEQEVRPYLYGLNLPKMASLKPYWRVAMSAILYRAGELECITPRTKKYLWFQMGSHGYRTHEPVAIPPEEPELLKDVFDVHMADLGYTLQDFVKLLFMRDEGELRNAFPYPESKVVGFRKGLQIVH